MGESTEVITSADVGVLPTKVPETRIARFHRLLALALPERAKDIAEGTWGPAGAPYRFLTLRDGGQRLVIDRIPSAERLRKEFGPDVDPRDHVERLSITGATRDELLDRLEARLKGASS